MRAASRGVALSRGVAALLLLAPRARATGLPGVVAGYATTYEIVAAVADPAAVLESGDRLCQNQSQTCLFDEFRRRRAKRLISAQATK